MEQFDVHELKKLYLPKADSHKRENGKLLVIGGSKLFHAASLWALSVASKLVDMVFYASVPENNAIVHEAKSEFRNGIVVSRDEIERYITESDAVLIGPGMLRVDHGISNSKFLISNLSLQGINQLEDEGEQSYYLTKYLLEKYPEKKWVIDAGALQMMDPTWLRELKQPAIVTPHPGEFERVFGKKPWEDVVPQMAKEFRCIILVKGREDMVCSPEKFIEVKGGNAGLTKGGTGDVLAGLVAALVCKNDPWLAAQCGSYINKMAGDELYKRVGFFFNASDLVEEIPQTMKRLLLG
jgi:NAD(P)H-hydrate epimerase